MKTNFLLTSLVIVLFTLTANSQITKGNWMVGGDGSYVNTTITQNNYTSKYTITEINPDIGYFIKDKFVIGSHLKFENTLYKDTGGSTHYSSYFLGIYTRYYFLKQKNIYNLFSQINYDYNIHTSDLTSIGHKYGVKLGGVVFFTNSVGLELSFGYDTNTTNVENKNSSLKTDNVKVNIGFHFYLEKK